jgi:heme exporter protein A
LTEVPFIEAHDVSRAFGRHFALHHVDLSFPSGQVSLVLGPNGAGKSTLLGILATLDRPTSGSLRYGPSMDGTRMEREGRGLIGFVSHESMLYGELTGMENLSLFARLLGVDASSARMRESLDAVGIDPAGPGYQRVRTYSRGMRQRLSLARALLQDPPVLILDEPFSGLDREGCQRVVELLTAARSRGRLLVIATHHLDLPRDFADRVVLLRRGRRVYEGCARWPLVTHLVESRSPGEE